MGDRDEAEANSNIEVALTEGLEFAPDWFSKPGDSLSALMRRRGLAADAIAVHFDGGMADLRGLLDGTQAIDDQRAASLAKHVGGTASFWLKRQAQYELGLGRAVDRAAATDSSNWLLLPVPGEKPRGALSEERRRSEIRRRLAFFGVGTIEAWEARYGRIVTETLYRKSTALTSNDASMLMWLRCGELAADLIKTRSWNPATLRDRLTSIRKLSKLKSPSIFMPKLRAICADAGVAVVAKRTPPRCPASGAIRMVASDKAMILLSFRGLSDDKFWFTLFHEIGHLLLHEKRTFVDADIDDVNELEREANEFALRCIIPDQDQDELEELGTSRDKVLRFSVRVGIAPGLTVGQLQHRRIIRHDQLNYLKRRWRWEDVEQIMD